MIVSRLTIVIVIVMIIIIIIIFVVVVVVYLFCSFVHFDMLLPIQDPAYEKTPSTMVYPIYVPIVFSFIAGMSAAQQQLALKCLSELAASSGDTKENPFETPFPYLILLFGIVNGVMQVAFVNEGMKRFHNTIFIPIYNASFIVFNILSGAIFFGEIYSFETKTIVLFIIGSLFAIFGQLQLLYSESDGKEAVKEAVKMGRVSIHHISEEVVIELRRASLFRRTSRAHSHALPLPSISEYKPENHPYGELKE